MFKTIADFLSKEKAQKMVYWLLIPIWTCLWYFDDLQQYPNKSLLDISWLIPTSLLVCQAIFNNILVWTLLFGLVSIIGLCAIRSTLGNLFEGTHYVIGNIVLLLSTFTGILIVYLIKPTKKLR